MSSDSNFNEDSAMNKSKSTGQSLKNRMAMTFGASVLTIMAISFLTTGCTKKIDDKDTTIYAVLAANVKGMDPARAGDLYSSTVIAQIYEGLLEYNYLKRPYTLQPALADGMPVVTDNGLTHTFKIKKGVRFQDNAAFPDGKGRELTAQDFVYSFKRLSDPRITSDGFWIFDGKIKGLNEWVDSVKAEKANYDTPVEGLSAPEKYTLVIKLVKPYYQLDSVLAMSFASVIPKEAVDKYASEFLNNPVGTGPFMLEKSSDWIRNSKITLKKNPNWRGETFPTDGEPADKAAGLLADAGKPLPFAEKIVFTELVEAQPRWQNFMKGNFDFAEIPNDNFDSAVKKDNAKELQPELAGKGIHLEITPAPDVTYHAFNMKDPILGKNKGLRQAMALANDTPTYIAKFLNGRGVSAEGPVPPGLDSYDPEYKNPLQRHDIEKAKALLAKAGFPEGKGLPEFAYDTLSDSKARQTAEFFSQNMAAIGIKVKIVSNTWPQFQEKIKGGRAQIFGIAWGADYPDPQNFFQLFYSKNVSPGPNDSSYASPEFDKAYEASLNLPPGNERNALYKKMRDIVTEDSPWIFQAHRQGYRLVHGWLNNFKWNDIQNDYFKYLRVDPKKRADLKAKL
jgi:oligopeptide transport system substrate-binding protein